MNNTPHQKRSQEAFHSYSVQAEMVYEMDLARVKNEIARQMKGLSEYNVAQYVRAKINKALGKGSDIVHTVYFDN